jgi:RNA polymerase sigma-70 factor (ECF subfamily)
VLLDQVFRDEWGRVLANLVGFLGDFDLAEEAAQDAFATAAERWPRDGTPPNPGAWLTVTARNRAIDRLRRDRVLAEKTRLLGLGAALAELMPDEAEVHGLVALMLLDDARREARLDDGDLVLLADQDRTRWDAAKIARGRESLDRALALHAAGPYVVQAAIASLHMDEPHDWPEIAALYGELARLTGSPVVELNRAIAVAEAEGPEAGLALVDRVELEGYQYFHSTRADLLRRLDRADEASAEYERALELAHSEHERRFLERRIAEVRT